MTTTASGLSVAAPAQRWWEALFSDEEQQVYGAYQAAPAERMPPHGRHPALIVVDVTRAFCGEPGQSLLESVREWPPSCGPYAWAAMPHIQRLLAAARDAQSTVVYTTAQPGGHRYYGGVVTQRKPGALPAVARPGGVDIPPQVAPREGELVLQKPKASAFFATPLLAYLLRAGVDCLLVCGATTSGCVRATVVDGFSWGFPVYLAEEATFDRSRLSHGVGLYEMNTKYAQVIPVEEAVQWLADFGQD
jgi:nicotinamidase-related amidase